MARQRRQTAPRLTIAAYGMISTESATTTAGQSIEVGYFVEGLIHKLLELIIATPEVGIGIILGEILYSNPAIYPQQIYAEAVVLDFFQDGVKFRSLQAYSLARCESCEHSSLSPGPPKHRLIDPSVLIDLIKFLTRRAVVLKLS